jgi:hypothetical protein
MDEIETARNLRNLRVLIDHVTEPDNVYAHVNIKNALLVIAAVLSGLDERITEMQVEDDC